MDVNKVQKIIISYLETGTIESVTDSRNLAVAIKEAYDAGLLREKDDGQLKIEFLGWWKAFPSTDKYGPFPKTRILRCNKEKCFLRWKKLRKELDYDLIMLTLSEELKWRKSPTSNKLKYMKNSYAWLNQVDFGEKQTKEQVLDIKIV